MSGRHQSHGNKKESKFCCVCFAHVPLGLNWGRCPVCEKGMSENLKDELRRLDRSARARVYAETANHAHPLSWTYEVTEQQTQELIEQYGRKKNV
jgi:hypothetical protein